MKRAKQCPKCSSLRIGCVEENRHMVLGKEKGWIGDPMGKIENYFCADCGYLELYIHKPEDLTLDELDGFRWINTPQKSDTPFR